MALALLGAFGCAGPSEGVTLQGSGATFPAPVYKRWFLDYYREHAGIRVNYSPIGSGAGIRQFTAGLVDFGASDAGMSPKEIAKLPPDFEGVFLLPMTAGCIVLSYNLSGLASPLRLSRNAYVKIFLREITRWNDAQITKDNPGVALPDSPIVVVTRADSSGTTYAFTNHMSAVAKSLGVEWAPGVDKSVNWKESIAGDGNDGVAALIQLTPGALGYLELGYAYLAHMPTAMLENQSHRYILADEKGDVGRLALEGATIPADLQIKVPDPKPAGAYPIVTYTWMLTRKHQKTSKTAEALKTLVRYCLEDSQQEIAEQLGYIRLPPDVTARVLAEIANISGPGDRT